MFMERQRLRERRFIVKLTLPENVGEEVCKNTIGGKNAGRLHEKYQYCVPCVFEHDLLKD